MVLLASDSFNFMICSSGVISSPHATSADKLLLNQIFFPKKSFIPYVISLQLSTLHHISTDSQRLKY